MLREKKRMKVKLKHTMAICKYCYQRVGELHLLTCEWVRLENEKKGEEK